MLIGVSILKSMIQTDFMEGPIGVNIALTHTTPCN